MASDGPGKNFMSCSNRMKSLGPIDPPADFGKRHGVGVCLQFLPSPGPLPRRGLRVNEASERGK